MVRTAVESDKSQNKITELCYTIRDPYHIIHISDYGSNYVKKS